MLSILTALSKTNHFKLDNHGDFGPSKSVLAQQLGSLQNDAVYVNHAAFLNGTASDLIWINVVREPIPRWSSLFYYAVDVSLRGERAATELATRAKDTRCGCAGLEFYECIEMRHHHNCSLKVPSQITSFCEPREACSRELATARVHASYRLVGLTEELEMTLKVLEKMLPRFFRGVTDISTKGSPRATSLGNKLTNTSLNGAIPDRTRKLIKEHAVNYKDEQLFYEDTKRLFWHQACEQRVLPYSPLPSPPLLDQFRGDVITPSRPDVPRREYLTKAVASPMQLLLRDGPQENRSFLTVSLAKGGWHLRHDRGYYNSTTGWLMKARYNCQGDERSPPATAWVHLPDREGNRTWNHIVQEFGGHRHVAEAAMMHTSECGQQRTHILILGNSYMRQVFEAVANRFRKYVTAGVLNARSPPMGMEQLKQSKHVNLGDFEFINLPVNGSMTPGCHGSDVAKFYKQDPPPSLQGCQDNVAWVEFNQTLRIYYIFRPWAITGGVHGILQRFGTSIHAIDVLVCNDNCGMTDPQVRNDLMRSCRGNTGGKQFIDFGSVRANLQAQLQRDANRTYGATNGIADNDGHPCMPGLPDDEVDILFAAIATGRNCTFFGRVSERDAEFWH